MKKSQKLRWFIFPGMMAVFALAISPFFASKAQASPPSLQTVTTAKAAAPAAQSGLIEKVGLYVLGISDLNVAAGSYSMDVYLNFKCNLPCNTDPDKVAFDVMNATDEPNVSDQTSDTQGNTVHYYRVRVPLADNLDLRDFPFDYHHLSMQIEDKIFGTSDLNYEFDPEKSGVDDYAVVSGWNVQKSVTAEAFDHDYHIYSEPYSRLVFKVAIYHPWFSSFMKGLFAAIVIVLVGMLSFLMKYDEISERLALVSSTLVGAILYHLTLTSSIPPIGYMTFADRFMYTNYFVIFIALSVTVGLMLYLHAGQEEKAKRLNASTRLLIPAIWVVSMVYLIVFGMSIPLWDYISKYGF